MQTCFVLIIYRLLYTRMVQEGHIFGEQGRDRRYTIVFLFGLFRNGSKECAFTYNSNCGDQVYFDSDEVHACIVTCGGLCPGLNTVIRELVCGLNYMYGVTRILGIDVSGIFVMSLHLRFIS